jgi:predicted acyltransferase
MPSAEQPQVVDRVGRLWSIDALRGFDMFWIIGGEVVIERLAEWGGWRYHGVIKDQLEHAPWEGFHFEDLIFPLFLFLVGVVLPFSLGKLTGPGVSRRAAYVRIIRRTLLLYALGLVYYGRHGVLDFAFSDQRYLGVLQRIAICYGIAAFITLHTRARGQVAIVFAILLGYWAILTLIRVPGTEAGRLTPEGNLSGYLDRKLLPGHLWTPYYDNEGLLSTVPAVATTLLGALAGQWLRSRQGALAKTAGLAAAGAVCLAVGMAWAGMLPEVRDLVARGSHHAAAAPAKSVSEAVADNPWIFPSIKNLWTSSFVLIAGGWSLLLLALFYGVIDGLGFKAWSFFFVVIGANAIVIYLANDMVDFKYTSKYLFDGLSMWAETLRLGPGDHPSGLGPVVDAVGELAVKWLFLCVLYRHRIFLRV